MDVTEGGDNNASLESAKRNISVLARSRPGIIVGKTLKCL
jgi:hypothetical protein